MFRHFFESERQSRHLRLFQRGDIKYVILDMLKDKPSHGCEMMRALEERFHGFYPPSVGSVYPTLQLLEDMGYVTSSATEGKKVYSITEAGTRFLADREKIVDEIRATFGSGGECITARNLERLFRRGGMWHVSLPKGPATSTRENCRRSRK